MIWDISRYKINITNITKQLFITLTFQVQHPLPPVSSCTPLAGRHDSVAVWPSSCAPEGSCCCPWLAWWTPWPSGRWGIYSLWSRHSASRTHSERILWDLQLKMVNIGTGQTVWRRSSPDPGHLDPDYWQVVASPQSSILPGDPPQLQDNEYTFILCH